MASEAPLLLYDIGYGDDLRWTYAPTALASIAAAWEQAQQSHSLRGAMYHSMGRSLWERPVVNPGACAEAMQTAVVEVAGAVTTGLKVEYDALAAAAMMGLRADRTPVALLPPAPEASFVPWGSLCAHLRAAKAGSATGGGAPPAAGAGQPAHIPLAKRPKADSAETKSAKKAKKQGD